MQRELIFFKDYFNQFYIGQTQQVKDKIDFVLRLVTTVQNIPEKFFKHIEGSDGLFEIRVQQGNNIFRIFCCFDSGHVVVLLNGFQKKSQKTPKNEIELAEKIKKDYFNWKKLDNGK
jgi:phage-related protein